MLVSWYQLHYIFYIRVLSDEMTYNVYNIKNINI